MLGLWTASLERTRIQSAVSAELICSDTVGNLENSKPSHHIARMAYTREENWKPHFCIANLPRVCSLSYDSTHLWSRHSGGGALRQEDCRVFRPAWAIYWLPSLPDAASNPLLSHTKRRVCTVKIFSDDWGVSANQATDLYGKDFWKLLRGEEKDGLRERERERRGDGGKCSWRLWMQSLR